VRAVIAIDADSPAPLYRQIYEAWRSGILTGRFRGGERVPSTRDLAHNLAVSRSTVTQAYDQLIAEGYLQSIHGAGTFVCSELPDELLLSKAKPKVRAFAPVHLSRFAARLMIDFVYSPTLPGFINLSHWTPDLDSFPNTLWRKLMLRHLRKATPAMFNYATDAQGYAPLRAEIAAYVARSRAVLCTPEQIVIVNGSQQALDFCARLLLEEGEEIALEDPGYLGAQRIFTAYGAKLRPVRVDVEGLVVENIGKRARAVHVTPSHQFPTGVAMSLRRRLALIEWAKQHAMVLIEDDYDSEYRYSGPPLPALQGLSQDVAVIYCGTFSKVMFPGLRIGYVVVPPPLAPAFARLKGLADRHTTVLEQLALVDFLREGHLERHVRRMRRLYGRRREVLIESLRRHFGERCSVIGDPAGMHMLVRFQDEDILERSRRNKVQLTDARNYYLTPSARNEFVIGFSAVTERTIREGIRRLAVG
jgi:GntR family transcriptional regulator/MocR family aminotransferase